MRIKVRLFAVYREQAGAGELSLEVPEGSTPADVFARLQEGHPRLRPISSPLGVAVNMDYQDPGTPLREGDEVAFIPPVSGGASGDGLYRLSEEPLDPRRVEKLVEGEGYGGMVTFQGRVRNPNKGHAVVHLDYEAFAPMALKEMETIGQEVRERWPEVRLAMEHRVGQAGPGEPTVCIAAAAPHRAEAFDACRYVIDQLKARVPIWKKEVWTDGQEWVRPGEHEH